MYAPKQALTAQIPVLIFTEFQGTLNDHCAGRSCEEKRKEQHRDRKRQGNSDGHLLCLSCCSGLSLIVRRLYVSVFILLCLGLSYLLSLFCFALVALCCPYSFLVLFCGCPVLSCLVFLPFLTLPFLVSFVCVFTVHSISQAVK